MAIFNPAVQPTQDPNYLNYSRVLDAPTPNLSSKIAIETAAVGLDSAVSVTDTAIKKSIQDSAYKAVDPLRDEMTAGLEKIKGDLDKGIIPKPQQTVAGASTDKSWLDANAMAPDPEELPVGLESGIDGVRSLAAAKQAGSPKLNDTKYAGEVLAEAKRLRNQYGPGYREYIDDQISKASGLPVANSYYNNMLLDINRQMSQMAKVKDDVGGALMKAQDMPGQADLIIKRKNGDPSANDAVVLTKINEWENFKQQITIDAALRKQKVDNKSTFAEDQEARLTRAMNTNVRIEMSALNDAALPGGGSGKDLATFLADYAAGKYPGVSETQLNQRRLQYNNWVAGVKQRMLVVSQGYSDVVGGPKTEQAVEAAMAPIYAQQKFFNNKEDGPGYYVTRQIEHIKKDAESGILLNKDYGKEATQLLGARGVFGEQYFPQWIANFVDSGVMQKFQGIVGQEAMSAIEPYKDDRGNPIPRYHKDAIQHGKNIGATGDDDYFGEKGVTKVVGEIGNPNINLEARERLVNYAFNKKNVGRLEELKMDYRDPQTGEMVPGRYRMFNILSSQRIVQGVKEVSLAKPENYQKFQGTLETEFGRLYRSTIQDINKLVSVDKAGLGLHYSFNDKTNQFGLVDKNNRPIEEDPRIANAARIPAIQNPNSAYIASMNDKVKLINGALANMANVHRNNPQGAVDTPKYLLQTLQSAGFRSGNIAGATESMQRAIIRSRNPDMTPADLDKQILGPQPGARSNFTPEEDRSLANFLRSPAGNITSRPPPRSSLEPYQTRGVIQGNLSDQPIDAPIRTRQ